MDTEKAKSLLGIKSDYRLAKMLGVTKQAVSKWRCKYGGVIPADRQEQIRAMVAESALADSSTP